MVKAEDTPLLQFLTTEVKNGTFLQSKEMDAFNALPGLEAIDYLSEAFDWCLGCQPVYDKLMASPQAKRDSVLLQVAAAIKSRRLEPPSRVIWRAK